MALSVLVNKMFNILSIGNARLNASDVFPLSPYMFVCSMLSKVVLLSVMELHGIQI